jgi:uncharacterized protein (TIGR02147 family)
MKPVFEYMDYRLYLKDFLAEKQAANAKFSQRLACLKIGLKSPGHLSQILGGRTNISLNLAERLMEFFRFKAKETDYFRLLVLFCQAKSHVEKAAAYEKLIKLKQPKIKLLLKEQFEFYDKWYYTAIREVLSIHRFRGDYRALAKAVLPNITPLEAEKAILLLEKLGLIVKNRNGVYDLTGAAISSGYDVQSIALNNFVMGSLGLAKHALDTVPSEDRNLSWTTFSVSRPTFLQIEEELRAFRRRIQALAVGDPEPDRAYQINFQLFPISPHPKGKSPS